MSMTDKYRQRVATEYLAVLLSHAWLLVKPFVIYQLSVQLWHFEMHHSNLIKETMQAI